MPITDIRAKKEDIIERLKIIPAISLYALQNDRLEPLDVSTALAATSSLQALDSTQAAHPQIFRSPTSSLSTHIHLHTNAEQITEEEQKENKLQN